MLANRKVSNNIFILNRRVIFVKGFLNMLKPRVGIYAFGESFREELYQKNSLIGKEEVQKVIRALEPFVEIVAPEPRLIRRKKDVLEVTAKILAAKVDAVLFMVPIWTAPSLVVMAGRLINHPPLLLGNYRPGSQTLFLAVGGALTQTGIAHERIVGDPSETAVVQKILTYIRAATAVSRLKGQTFGCIGGRSLGIVTATADPAQWQKIFGVDIEHIDQSVIIRKAQEIDAGQVTRHLQWVKQNFGKVEIEDSLLEKQVRSYLATKALLDELELDFIGIKCQTDLSDWYCLQCLSAALIGDPYDAEGAKEAVACSCEADHDGALTMQILKLISGGKPTALVDFKDVKAGELVLANCGSSPTWFAGDADESIANTRQVHLLPHAFGNAGGASVQFVFAKGQVTLARLCQRDGNYEMLLMLGETIEKPREEMRKTGWVFPHAFVKCNIEPDKFFSTMNSNHIHIVAGNYLKEVELFCKMLNIPCRIL
jgi:L-fucose isomerase